MKDHKIKIKFNQTHISDEEILVFKNFESLLETHQKINIFSSNKRYLIILLVMFSGTILFYALNNNSQKVSDISNPEDIQNTALNEQEEENKKTLPPLLTSPEIQLNNIVTTPKEADTLKEAIAEKAEKHKNTDGNNEEPKREKSFKANSEVDTISTYNETSQSVPDYEYVDARPEEGFTAIYDYFNEEMIYPEQAKIDELEGIVILEFTVTDKGEITNVKIINGVSPEIDEEAVRLITQMPKWIPATINGRNVKSILSIPLNFRLEKTSE